MKKQLLNEGQSEAVVIEQTPEIKVGQPKKPISAYFYFIQDIKKSGENKASLSELGQMWNNLTQDYKEKFQTLARQDKERYQLEMQNYVSQNPEYNGQFPISRLKSILSNDDDKRIFNKDAYVYFERAVELFGQEILEKVKQNVQFSKRKQIQEEDLNTIIRENEELEFLSCLVNKSNKIKQQQKQKILEEDEKGQLGQTTGILKFINQKPS